LFSSLKEGPPVDIVLLQDPPSSKRFLPTFSGFKSFAPPITSPKLACSTYQKLLQKFAILPLFRSETDNFMALDGFTPHGYFGSTSPHFRIGNFYVRPLASGPHSVSPESSLPDLNYPLPVAGDSNIHNSSTNPFRLLSSKEARVSTPILTELLIQTSPS